MNLRANRAKLGACVLVTALAGILGVPAIAHGDTVGDKKAQAQQLQAAIDENGRKADALSEQINGAQYRLDQAQAQAADAQARIDQAQAQTDNLQHLLSLRALQIYKGAGNSTPLDAVDVSNVTELGARTKYASAASNHDNALVSQLTKAREDLATQKAQFDDVQRQATAERDSLTAAKRDIQAANGKQQELLGQVKGEIATLVQQEQTRRDNEARAHAAAAASAASGGGGSRSDDVGVDPGNFPAPSGAAAAAVNYAREQLGKPYVYAAAGPDSFDCSGLVMYVYGLAGVSLPHFSGAQYDATVHIPESALQPGDLIFWGPGGDHHVGIYVGGGTMIHAPQTGDVVRYSNIYGSPSGYGRVG